MKESKGSIFQQPVWVVLFALTAATLWGWAYPLIKLGFIEFRITPGMLGSKILFAGTRFFLSGLIILSIARAKQMDFSVRRGDDWFYLLLFTLLNTTLHYAFFYVGLSYAPGARSAILNSLSVFAVVILATIFYKDEKFTRSRLLGCIVGLTGILTLNLGADSSGHFTFFGDGFIILNALCGAMASLMVRGVHKRVNIFVGTGYSLSIGGLLLLLYGIILGGTFPHITFLGMGYLAMLISISTIGFTLYNKLISLNPVGKVAIFNSIIPPIGAITSCLCLGEPFYLKYLLSATLSALGIYIINKGK